MKATRKVTPPDLALLRIDRLCTAARRSAEVRNNDIASRDAAIGEADRRGFGVRAIWRATGKTDDERIAISQVDQIILRQAAKRQAGSE